MLTHQQLLERISIDPKVMVGQPVIRGTRLTVDHILKLLDHGVSIRALLEEYDGLTVEDIQACILFASRSFTATDVTAQLPDDFEDIFGETVEEILADETLWDAQFANTEEKLRRLAEQAAEEYRAGRTSPMAFEE